MAINILVPLILAAASMGANYAGQRKTDKARAAALQEARRLQDEKSREAETAAKNTADLFANNDEKEATAATEQEARYTEATQGGDAQASLADILSNAAPTGATSFVNEKAAMQGKANARTAQRAKSMAKLSAFGDVMVGNEIASARNRADIGRAGTDMLAWNQNVLPMQLEAANAKGKNLHTLADALQVASMLTSMGAMSGTSAGLDAATTASLAKDAGAGIGMGTAFADFSRKRPLNYGGNAGMNA